MRYAKVCASIFRPLEKEGSYVNQHSDFMLDPHWSSNLRLCLCSVMHFM